MATIVDEWGPFGDMWRKDDECGYTDDDHVYDGVPLKCMRRAGHAGARLAADQHLGSLDTHPIFFGTPLVLKVDPETGEYVQ